MDALHVIDSLDSFWFFSNALSPTTEQQLVHASAEYGRVQEQPTESIRRIEENMRNESPCARNFGRRCSNCGVFAPELQPEALQQQPFRMEVPVVERAETEEKIESRRRRRRRRSKRSFHESRKVLGELDLLSESSSLLLWGPKSGYQTFGSRHYVNTEMPPLNDGIAMKEHLKSWAQAVACNFR